MTTIHQLPYECLNISFSFLTYRDLCASRETCSSWNTEAEEIQRVILQHSFTEQFGAMTAHEKQMSARGLANLLFFEKHMVEAGDEFYRIPTEEEIDERIMQLGEYHCVAPLSQGLTIGKAGLPIVHNPKIISKYWTSCGELQHIKQRIDALRKIHLAKSSAVRCDFEKRPAQTPQQQQEQARRLAHLQLVNNIFAQLSLEIQESLHLHRVISLSRSLAFSIFLISFSLAISFQAFLVTTSCLALYSYLKY